MKNDTHSFVPGVTRPAGTLVLSIMVLLLAGGTLSAADYYPPRISHLDGASSYLPAGKVDWEPVSINVPLLDGDRVFSQLDSRVEIELGDANFLRLADETDVTFNSTLNKEIQLTLDVGVVILRLNKSRRFRIFTPHGTVEIRKKGLYRLGVDDSGQTQVIVRKGRAEIEGPAGKQKLRSEEEIVLGGRYQGPMQVSQYSYQDEFDRWSDRRDASYLKSQSVAYVGSYLPGVYALDRHGYWTSYPGYGRVWIPHVSFGWSPYRSGFWFRFGFGFGWTWISHEPWGWLPYHYGNWHYYRPHRRWCWIPGGFHRWHPHRARFYHGGGYVGWAPSPHRFNNNNNVTVINNNTVINRPPREGLTVVREENFGRGRGFSENAPTVTRQVAESMRPGLPQNLPAVARGSSRGGSVGPPTTTSLSNRAGRSNNVARQQPGVTSRSRTGAPARSVSPATAFTDRSAPSVSRRSTERVLRNPSTRSDGGRPPAVVNLPSRTETRATPTTTRGTSRDTYQRYRNYRNPRGATSAGVERSQPTVNRVERQQMPREAPDPVSSRRVPRISRPDSGSPAAPSRSSRSSDAVRSGSRGTAPSYSGSTRRSRGPEARSVAPRTSRGTTSRGSSWTRSAPSSSNRGFSSGTSRSRTRSAPSVRSSRPSTRSTPSYRSTRPSSRSGSSIRSSRPSSRPSSGAGRSSGRSSGRSRRN